MERTENIYVFILNKYCTFGCVLDCMWITCIKILRTKNLVCSISRIEIN